jgi:uncharacterized membrane protein YgdD (TMEM256/DUF423 family)
LKIKTKTNFYLNIFNLSNLGLFLILTGIFVDAISSHNDAFEASFESLQLATKYQLFSGLFLLLVAWKKIPNFGVTMIALGVTAFSISIEISALLGINLGFVTPLGGAIMILGWIVFIFHCIRHGI